MATLAGRRVQSLLPLAMNARLRNPPLYNIQHHAPHNDWLAMDEQEKRKLDRKRARNRAAATKCRQKKIDRIQELEGLVRVFSHHQRHVIRTFFPPQPLHRPTASARAPPPGTPPPPHHFRPILCTRWISIDARLKPSAINSGIPFCSAVVVHLVAESSRQKKR
ncbi:bZIP transcription factor [Ancylostoma duodenale]|uniref:BZIP transcription factor n=1 Tax=Ancylostoma duodenale TaxID=51022 RepID=A0A0C2GW46_9BILA|nr:bZIP transcription factor [Ancylostoma duodenale]